MKTITILLLSLVVTSCSTYNQRQVNNAFKVMTARATKLLGKTEADVIKEYGVPTKSYTTDKLKVLHYYTIYGTQSSIHQSPINNQSYSSNSYSKFDKIDYYIKDGKVTDWKGYAQR